MSTSSLSLTAPVQAGAPGCPACGATAYGHIGDVSIDEQFRQYAPGNAAVHGELTRRSGLDFQSYSRRECAACGLRFSSPMRAPGGDWYAYAYNTLDIHAVGRWEFDDVLDALGPSDRIGEIGCGTGIFLARARDRGISARGLDFSATSVAECGRKGLDAQRVHVDLDDLRIARDRSAIVSFHVLEHLGEPARLFDVASRWAVPGATLWIAVPSDRNMTRLKGKRDVLDEPPHHLTQWTEGALRQIGDANGWRLERLVYEHMGSRQRLWTLCAETALYRGLAGRPGPGTGWADRLLRYALYPGIAVSQWGTFRKLSGLSMLARYRRSDSSR